MAAGVASTVDGDRLGSDDFGSLTLREALSKPLPRPLSWFWLISPSSVCSGVSGSAAHAPPANVPTANPALLARKARRLRGFILGLPTLWSFEATMSHGEWA